jgi:alcohol dehydrogenase
MLRRAYRVHRTGALSALRLCSEELPPMSDNDVVVQVQAIGLNFADIFAIFGLYSATPKESFVPGLEYAGIVVQKGANVSQYALGDRVMGAIRFGAYTTHVVIDSNYVVPLPPTWSFTEGASFLVQALTAYYALHHLGGIPLTPAQKECSVLPARSAVLIHSAAGGVGLYAHRILKAAQSDALTIGTIGSAAKTDVLHQEGYTEVIVRQAGNSRQAARHFRSELDATLGRHQCSLQLVLDSLGGRMLRECYQALAPAGRIVCFGSAHLAFQGMRPKYVPLLWKYIQRPRFDPLAMIEENKAILGFNLIYLWDNLPLMRRMIQELESLQLPKPYVGQRFAFSNLLDALVMFQSGNTVGKVVVELSPDDYLER